MFNFWKNEKCESLANQKPKGDDIAQREYPPKHPNNKATEFCQVLEGTHAHNAAPAINSDGDVPSWGRPGHNGITQLGLPSPSPFKGCPEQPGRDPPLLLPKSYSPSQAEPHLSCTLPTVEAGRARLEDAEQPETQRAAHV